MKHVNNNPQVHKMMNLMVIAWTLSEVMSAISLQLARTRCPVSNMKTNNFELIHVVESRAHYKNRVSSPHLFSLVVSNNL